MLSHFGHCYLILSYQIKGIILAEITSLLEAITSEYIFLDND